MNIEREFEGAHHAQQYAFLAYPEGGPAGEKGDGTSRSLGGSGWADPQSRISLWLPVGSRKRGDERPVIDGGTSFTEPCCRYRAGLSTDIRSGEVSSQLEGSDAY